MLIAQITDLHIVEKNQHWLSESATNVRERLLKTISYLNALNPRPNVVFLTGDLTDTGTEASYLHLKELLGSLEIPLYVIPGNHDRREELRSAFLHHPYMPREGSIHYAIDDYPVRLIGLDTLVEGKDHGVLSQEQLSWVENTLKKDSRKPTLIFMHHPPIKIGMKLFDQINCIAPQAFESLIKERENVIGVLTGHYHHLCVGSFGSKLCYLAPSVAPVHYFAHPEDTHVTALELDDPALTLHRWHGENRLTSHSIRIKENPRRIDWALIEKKNHRQVNQ